MNNDEKGLTRIRKWFLLMFLATGMIAAHAGGAWGLDAPVFSIEAKNEPLQNVFQKVSQATGYEIVLSPKWGETPVSIKLENAGLEDGVRAILRKLAGFSHALIIQEEEKRVSLFIFPSSKTPDVPSFADRQSRMPFQPPFRMVQPPIPTPAESEAPPEQTEQQETILPGGEPAAPSDLPAGVEGEGESPPLHRQP